MHPYQRTIETITRLNWNKLRTEELEELMVLSAYAALEFAESLRLTLAHFPTSTALAKMAAGELETNNLQWKDYGECGDHADFLWHFVNKADLQNKHSAVQVAGETYLATVRKLPASVRIASIISRERELPLIFQAILEAKDWSTPALCAFKYYLERHITLDSEVGGHAALLHGFVVDEAVVAFYETRLAMYRCIPTLFA